jgi:alkylation response protein AidB-like acyl-CoA dehydrogenase
MPSRSADPATTTGGSVPFVELEAAKALAREIMSRARDLESARRLPADLARKLAEAGLFRITIPKTYGGAELHPIDLVRVLEEVSRADGSAGWCVMIGATTAVLSCFFNESSASEIYSSNPLVITGGAVAPTGKAFPKPGGYVVSGRWQWGSGSQNCHWLVGGSLVTEAGADSPPRDHSGDPEIRLMIFPAGEAEIIDTWDAAGLRGTGSHDFLVREVFVPEDRSLALRANAPVIRRPLYHFPFFGLLAVGVCAVSLGIARRAIDEFVALAATKTPTWERKPLTHSVRVQAIVAQAEAAVRSARAFLFESIDAAWRTASALQPPSLEQRRDLRLAATNAAWQSVKAVELVYHAAGGSAVHSTNPLQRCLRDANVVTQHVMVNETMYEQAGRLYLGVGPEPALL